VVRGVVEDSEAFVCSEAEEDGCGGGVCCDGVLEIVGDDGVG